MRAKKPNALSRRRSRRPNGDVYRDLRKVRSRRHHTIQRVLLLIALVACAVVTWRYFFGSRATTQTASVQRLSTPVSSNVP
jgi:multidrug resistance efflux pump